MVRAFFFDRLTSVPFLANRLKLGNGFRVLGPPGRTLEHDQLFDSDAEQSKVLRLLGF